VSAVACHTDQPQPKDSPVVGIPLVDDVVAIVEHPDRVEFILDPAYAPESAPSPRSYVIWNANYGAWFACGPDGQIHGGCHFDHDDAVAHAARLDVELAEDTRQHAEWLDQHYGVEVESEQTAE
jgi:hypothetical protein